MSTEHFIPGKDASLEASIYSMQGKLEGLLIFFVSFVDFVDQEVVFDVA